MAGLPQLILEDVQCMDAALSELLRSSEGTAAFIIDKGGPVICKSGAADQFDSTTISALAAGSFCATQAIAERLGETNFTSVYQQGDHTSLMFCNVDENLLLVVIFNADLSVGAVKYYAAFTVTRVAAQLQRAQNRAPEATVDLVSMNIADVSDVFRKGS